MISRTLMRVLVAAAPCISFGQAPATPLTFEVASVKPASAPITTQDAYSAGYNAGMRAALAERGLRVVGQRVNVTDNTMRDLIRLAYQVKDYQISGPRWIGSDKFEIAAVMPAGATASQAPMMLATLLKERFHLEVHRETRKLPAYALVTAKGGPKLTAAAGTTAGRGSAGFGRSGGRVLAKGSSLNALADLLTKIADRPVIDETGIAGLYDVDMNYALDPAASEPGAEAADSGPSLTEALQKQLGLRLEKRDMQVEVLVIDRVERVPTEN